MKPPRTPDPRPWHVQFRRQVLIALIAAPFALVALFFMFRASSPTAALPDATQALAIAARQRAAAVAPPSAAATAPPSAAAVAPTLPSVAPLDAQTAEAPASSPAPVPATPDPPSPPTSQVPAPVASAPSVPVPAVTSPPQPVPTPRAPAERAAGATAVAPAMPPGDATTEAWMRQEFDQFLDQAGPPAAALSDPQRDALFAEFLAWRRSHETTEPAPPAQPGR